MLTFEYQLIYGEGWIADKGSVHADTAVEARAKIFGHLAVDDPCENGWIEKTDAGITKFVVYLTDATQGIGAERVEFWQTPTLFDSVVDIPIIC